jgi:hypothetical protein
MKKVLPLIAACFLMIAGFTTPAASASASVNSQRIITGEPEPHPNNLYVKLKLNGKTTTIWLLVFPSDTVGSVKSEIESWGVTVNYLSYNGQVLDESATLAFYGIGSNALIHAY